MATSYDDVEYPTQPRPLGHPAHMGAVARMFGHVTTPPKRARVLEIGCGDAVHLASVAVTMPDAVFVGFDLSSEAIARGRRLLDRTGIANVRLEVGDITTWKPDEPFDYIIAHGVYSWIPDAVRDHLMHLTARSLAPAGVACISYNCYPAGYTRQMLWEMMKYHSVGETDPNARIDKALELARFLRECRPKPESDEIDLYDNDLDLILHKQPRGVLYHDELAPVNQPVYFHEFEEHARAHGLRFVSELEPHVMANGDLPGEIDVLLRQLSRVNPERREQYFDFACQRRFRQTLLAREPHVPRGIPDASAIRDLLLTGNCGTDAIDLTTERPMTFAAGETAMEIAGALAKAAMVTLVESRPRRLTFDELIAAAAAKLGRTDISDSEKNDMSNELTAAWTRGLVLLKAFEPSYAKRVSDRPIASPFAREQIRSGGLVTSLLHLTLRVEDAPARKLVELLDGTRSFDDLVREIYPHLADDRKPSETDFRAGLSHNLEKFALSGMLIA
jgi:methyltransferase-like protein